MYNMFDKYSEVFNIFFCILKKIACSESQKNNTKCELSDIVHLCYSYALRMLFNENEHILSQKIYTHRKMRVLLLCIVFHKI